MTMRLATKRNAQLAAVALCAAAAKLYYSTTSVNELRWILAPTTALVELVGGTRFEFESHAGYVSGDRTFVIAASCAGVNFLITSFLMLSLGRLWGGRSRDASWKLIPWAAMCAYLATLVANAIRISTALRLREATFEAGWLNSGQLHRVEGVLVYFGCLLLLFVVSQKASADGARRSSSATFPLLVYYATTLGLPLVNGAHRQGADFWEHSLFVLLTPLLLLLPLAAFRLYRTLRAFAPVRETSS